MRILPTLAATVIAALVLAACGGGDSGPSDDGDNSALKFGGQTRAPAQVVEDFATAIRSGDWKRLCNEIYSAQERDLQKGLVADSCEDEVDRYGELKNLRITVNDVQVETSATVTADTASGGEASFDLKKEGDRWVIDGTSGDFTAGGHASKDVTSGSDDRSEAERTVQTFDNALEDEDWATVCSLLSDDRRTQYTNCVDEVADEYGGGALGLTVTDVEVKTEATVTARTGKGDGATFTLVPEGGRWHIDGYGGTFGNG
jgi:limonene-1,2-epoxide hydrolase